VRILLIKIFVEKIDNPDQKFWIWKEKITNKQDGRIYPTTVSNVGLGKSDTVGLIHNFKVKLF